MFAACTIYRLVREGWGLRGRLNLFSDRQRFSSDVVKNVVKLSTEVFFP